MKPNGTFSEMLKSENMPKPMRVLRRICEVSLAITAVYFLVGDTYLKWSDGEPNKFLYEILVPIGLYSAAVGIITFCIVGSYVAGKVSKDTSTASAIGRTLSKVGLYVFLPALLLTAVAFLIATVLG